MATFTIDPVTQVVNPRVLVIIIPDQTIEGQAEVNRLIIYTGTMILTDGVCGSDDLFKDTYQLNLSKVPDHPQFTGPLRLVMIPSVVHPGQLVLPAAPVVSLASTRWSDDAGDSTWAVDSADLLNDHGDPILTADTAIQGESCSLFRLSYQVNLLAHSE